MKSLARPSLFRLFDLLVSITNPGLKRPLWTHDGADFEREQHSAMGSGMALSSRLLRSCGSGRRGWSLLVIKEYWWADVESKALKNLRWARRPAAIVATFYRGCGRKRPRSAIEDSTANIGDEGELAALDDNDST